MRAYTLIIQTGDYIKIILLFTFFTSFIHMISSFALKPVNHQKSLLKLLFFFGGSTASDSILINYLIILVFGELWYE